MEAWQQRHIKLNIIKLAELTLPLDPLFEATLVEQGIISDTDFEGLSNRKSRDDAIAMYTLLMTKAGAFEKLAKALETSMKTGALQLLRQPYKPIRFNMNKPPTQFFGREVELENLKAWFSRKHANESIYDCIKVITGMAGIGKTELCRRFCDTYSTCDKQMNFAWINGESEQSIATSYENFAKSLRTIKTQINGMNRDLREIVRDIFVELDGFKFILVYDNVDNFDGINSFLSATHIQIAFDEMQIKPQILITSRNKWDRDMRRNCQYNLEAMNPEEAATWVLSSVNGASENDREYARSLVNQLQCYTLAIQQAISYINIRKQSIKGYRTGFANPQEVLQFDVSQFERSHPYRHTTFTTFITSISYVIQHNDGENSMKCLSMCAYLQPDQISVDMLIKAKIVKNYMDKGLVLLLDTSLLKEQQGQSVGMHRMLQEFLRWGLQGGFHEREFRDQILTSTNLESVKLESVLVKESNVLVHLMNVLNRYWFNEVEHAASIWKFCSRHAGIVKCFYKKSLYGQLKLTPMHLLIEQGDCDTLHVLIQTLSEVFSANEVTQLINKWDNCTRTPAFLAASAGNTLILRELQTANADFKIRSTIIYTSVERINNPCYYSTYWTAMHIAAYNGHEKTVEYLNLVDKGLGEMVDKFDETPALVASRFGFINIVRKISSHKRCHEICAVIKLIVDGKNTIDDLRQILQSVPECDLTTLLNSKIDSSNLTILTFAFRMNATISTLDFLLTSGASLGQDGTSFEELYQEIAINNNLSHLEWLIKENNRLLGKVTMYMFPKKQWTPVFDAAKYGSLAVLKKLTESEEFYGIRFNLDESDVKGDTPLYQAAYQGHLPIVKYLIEKGANVNCCNKWGSTPIIAAAFRAKFDVVLYLANLPETIFQPSEIKSGKNTLLGLLGLSVVHAAVAHDSVEITEKLLHVLKARDASIVHLMNSKNELGNETITLLTLAAFYGSADVIQYLQEEYKDDLEKNPPGNLSILLNAFMTAVENGTFHLPFFTKYAAKTVTVLVNWLPKSVLTIYPYTMASILNHQNCIELFKNYKVQPSVLSQILHTILAPTVKFYQQGMTDYLRVHRGSEQLAGDQVQTVVIKTFLGWKLNEKLASCNEKCYSINTLGLCILGFVLSLVLKLFSIQD